MEWGLDKYIIIAGNKNLKDNFLVTKGRSYKVYFSTVSGFVIHLILGKTV